MTDQATVSLLRWLRRQLRQPTPQREHLEAAVANDDPAEARRLLELFDFTEAQRRRREPDRGIGARPWTSRWRIRRERVGRAARSSTPSPASKGSRCATSAADAVDGSGRRRDGGRLPRAADLPLPRTAAEGDGRDVHVTAPRRAGERRAGGRRLPGVGSGTAGGSTSTRCSSSGSRRASCARCSRVGSGGVRRLLAH